MLSDLARGLRDLVFPSTCFRCQALLADDRVNFCTGCEQELADDPHATCPRCAGTVGEHANVSGGCPNCRADQFYFAGATRLGRYDGALRDAILRMKVRTGETFAECLGELWGRRLVQRLPDVPLDLVVPVPLHWWRRWRRGFNQAEILSAAVSAALHMEHRPNWLRRIRPTASQVGQTAAGRRENVKGAFSASRTARLAGRRVLLIDDVLTTGSTASEASRALLAGGAAHVHVAILAHQ